VYATTSDLEARWRPLTDAEAVIAGTLLADASAQIRSEFPTLDAAIAVMRGRVSTRTRTSPATRPVSCARW
jgi:hypothetical protein